MAAEESRDLELDPGFGTNLRDARRRAMDQDTARIRGQEFLGRGASKFVWWPIAGPGPAAIINSVEDDATHPDTKFEQVVEYTFTKHLKRIPGLRDYIPTVSPIDPSIVFSSDPGRNAQFRYLKERAVRPNDGMDALLCMDRILLDC